MTEVTSFNRSNLGGILACPPNQAQRTPKETTLVPLTLSPMYSLTLTQSYPMGPWLAHLMISSYHLKSSLLRLEQFPKQTLRPVVQLQTAPSQDVVLMSGFPGMYTEENPGTSIFQALIRLSRECTFLGNLVAVQSLLGFVLFVW